MAPPSTKTTMTGFPRSWKIMENHGNEKIKFKPGKVIENENLAKSYGKVIEFFFLMRR